MEQERKEFVKQTVRHKIFALYLEIVHKRGLWDKFELQQAVQSFDNFEYNQLFGIMQELRIDQKHVLRQGLFANFDSNSCDRLEAL